MDDSRFGAMISRLEVVARERPNHYLASVLAVSMLGFAILGFALLYALVPALLLLGFVAAVVLTGGKALILLLKLGKLLILLVIPAWLMIKSAFQMLFARFPTPEGLKLRPPDAPELFRQLELLRTSMNGPRIHHVLITDELNAAIMQHPRFGLFGWEHNYLILGFQLLQVLSPEEALSVVAHEYGHLSGHHSRLGGFIYRFRSAWGRMQQLSEQWTDWGSRAVSKLFSWYAPYFNAYTFVLARQDEYVADRVAAEVAGADHAGNALMRSAIASQFKEDVFWPSIHRMIADHPQPIANRAEVWQQILVHDLDEAARLRYLDTARQEETGHLDTHPALSDRLNAIGHALDETAAVKLTPPPQTAAEVWLGDRMSTIQQELDHDWQQGARQYWTERHQHLARCRQGLLNLQGKETLSVDERWQLIEYRHELEPDTDLMPQLNELLALEPLHASALFRRGTLLLNRGEEAGVHDLETLMVKDPDAILASCEAAWRFYLERNPERAEEYRQRWLARSEFEDRVDAERNSLPADAELVPHELDADTVAEIHKILLEHGESVKTAYLLRRNFKTDASLHDYVLAFETSRVSLGDQGPKVLKHLSSQEYPVSVFIVYLGGDNYKGFRKRIKQLNIAPVFKR